MEPFSDITGFRPYMLTNSSAFRKLLKADGMAFECATCALTTWQGQPAPLQIDHIDGNRLDNTRANLRFLCPNCHALTDTYSGRHVKLLRISDADIVSAARECIAADGYASVSSVMRRLGTRAKNRSRYERVVRVCEDNGLRLSHPPAGCRRAQERADWPSDDELVELLRKHPATTVGAMLGVSDNAVRKHLRVRGVSLPKLEKRT